MGSAFLGGDVVTEGIDTVVAVVVGPLHGDLSVDDLFGDAIKKGDFLSAVRVDNVRVDGVLSLVDEGNVLFDTAIELEGFSHWDIRTLVG